MTPRKPRGRASGLETNVAPDTLPDDLRRDDSASTPPDSLPPRDNAAEARRPAGGGFSPAEDGGVAQHPIHDEDQEDRTPGDYEREIDRLDAAARNRDD